MARFWGLDVHRHVVEACAIDGAGNVVARERFTCSRAELLRFAKARLAIDDELALEATVNTWGVVGVLQPFVGRIAVGNPLKTRVIAEAKVKTDKVDAFVLAQLLRTNFLPGVWIPDAVTQQLRRLTHRRAGLAFDRAGLSNRIHSRLSRLLLDVPASRLMSVRGREWLENVEIPTEDRTAIDADLRLIDAYERELDALDRELASLGYPMEQVKLLMTLPGVDMNSAMTLLGAWGDITRFKSADHAAAYLGLTPSVHQSADHCYRGRITKQGCRHARWIMVQAAQHLDKHPGPLGHFFRKLCRRRNRHIAVVAAARKLVVIAWHVLANGEPYRYAPPRILRGKLTRLRIKATGKRRTPGVAKGTLARAKNGLGTQTVRIPSLAELCQQEGLPAPKPLDELPMGEQRMLRQTGSLAYLERITNPSERLIAKTYKPISNRRRPGTRTQSVPRVGDAPVTPPTK